MQNKPKVMTPSEFYDKAARYGRIADKLKEMNDAYAALYAEWIQMNERIDWLEQLNERLKKEAAGQEYIKIDDEVIPIRCEIRRKDE